MANNGGRQGGGGGNQSMNEHVEFTVKAEEDLYLTGSENTILRVAAETNYSCLMLKTQRFSSLFRHYAKYHGLRKDDLEYYFVNPLENDDTPESVQLQRSDTIMVRKRRRPEPAEPAADDDEFFKDMRELLDDEEHMDAVFLVHSQSYPTASMSGSAGASGIGSARKMKSSSGKNIAKVGCKRDYDGDGVLSLDMNMSMNSSGDNMNSYQTPAKRGDRDRDGILSNSSSMAVDLDTSPDHKVPAQKQKSAYIEVRAHKCILTARAEYFKAHFRKSANASLSAHGGGSSSSMKVSFREPPNGEIQVEQHFSERTIRHMLEFIYTNRIQTITSISTNDLLSLLHLSDLWLLRDLKRLVEHELIRSHMDVTTVARMYCVTDDFHAKRLATACIEYIMDNIREVTGNKSFQEEMNNYPHLCIPVLKAAADLIPDQGSMHKKPRTSDHVGGGTSSTPSAGAVSSPVPDSDL